MVPCRITIHCSDSPNGRHVATDEIKRWHTLPVVTDEDKKRIASLPKEQRLSEIGKFGRGFNDIGYHAVIEIDGGVGRGRPENVQGAHVENHNKGNLGLCFVGRDKFTPEQFASAKEVIRNWVTSYGIDSAEIHCHRDFDTAIKQGKTCPNMEIDDIREWLDSGDDQAVRKYFLPRMVD